MNPLLAEAREALDRKDWTRPSSDVDRFLAEQPRQSRRDRRSRSRRSISRARRSSTRGSTTSPIATLVQLARLQPDYEDSAKLLQQARTRAIEQHYTQGLRLYHEEKLAEAISEWRLVLDLDPQHANAKKNIDQAEKLLKALDQRKKK